MNDQSGSPPIYDELRRVSDERYKELSEMMAPFVAVTDEYGRYLCSLVNILGQHAPSSTQDKVIRDLMADAFDALCEARRITLEAKLPCAFVLLRRAYESVSLLELCALDAKWAEKWQAGQEIGNAAIRKELGKHKTGTPESATKDLYKYFSTGSHCNRTLVPERYLGEGNEFTLGSIGRPELLLVGDQCNRCLQMWFWLAAVVGFYYLPLTQKVAPSLGKRYLAAAEEANRVNQWLVMNRDSLLEKLKAEEPQAGE